MKERNDRGRECGGTRRGESGGTEEEDGNAHKRGESSEEEREMGKDKEWRGEKTQGRRVEGGEKARE